MFHHCMAAGLLLLRDQFYVCVPVDSSRCLVPRIVGDPDVTLMKLHSDWLVVSVVEEDSVVFSCRHLQHVFISTDI